MIKIIFILCAFVTSLSFSFYKHIITVETSCGETFPFDLDQVPDDVTVGELVEYLDEIDDILC